MWLRRLLIVLCLVPHGPAIAAPGPQRLAFESQPMAQLGLNAMLTCGLQDDLGQMWLGTNKGLLRYDGRRGQVFRSDPRDPKSLGHEWVQDLAWTSGGRLLVATAGGLDVFDPATGHAQRLVLPGQRAGGERSVMALAPRNATSVWALGHYELFRFDLRRLAFEPVELPGTRAAAPGQRPLLRGLPPDGRGGVWLSAGGTEVLHIDAAGHLTQRWPLPDVPVQRSLRRALTLDADGRLWIGGDAGLVVMETASGRVLDLAERLGLPPGMVHALLRDDAGGVWVGHDQAGLWHWPRGGASAEAHRHHPALAQGLYSDTVSALLQDRSGVLWVGTPNAGVSRADLQRSGIAVYRHLPGERDALPPQQVMAVLPQGGEHLWLGTAGGGLHRLHLPTGRSEPVPAVPLRYVGALAGQPDGALLAGGYGGLFRLDGAGRRAERVDLADPDGRDDVYALARTPDGTLWVATFTGLVELAPGQPPRRHRQQPGGLASDRIRALLADRAGRLWIGTASGLQVLAGGRFAGPLAPVEPLPQPQDLSVRALREDAQGQVWVGTQIGLYVAQAGPQGPQLRAWSAATGFPEMRVTSLVDTPDGALWMTGDGELVRLDPDRRHWRVRASGAELGLALYAERSAALLSDGSLVFGGQGLLRLDPAALRENRRSPAVLLSDLRIFNRSLRDDPAPGQPGGTATELAAVGIDGPPERASRLRLTHREAMVSFDLRAEHFVRADQLRYAWRLEGFDRDWISGRPGEGLATYTNLDAGRYRLWAKAANPDGVWSEPRLLLEVEVLPPWWATAWFRLLGVLGLAGLLATAWQVRLRQLRRREHELQAVVERRTAEVQQQRQQIATLSEVGRELTASLDLQAVQASLMQHLASLMPATAFGLGFIEPRERVIRFDLMVQGGQRCRPFQLPLDALGEPAVQCVRACRPVRVQDGQWPGPGHRGGNSETRPLDDGGEPAPARSGLYVPLAIKGGVRGVLAALSSSPDAFSATHLDMLQTLAAYAAIALDNADAYRQLQRAQTQLVEQRKLASLGALVAGVAHELNTPLGNGLLAASTVREEGRRMSASVAQGQLRKSDLNQFLQSLEAASDLLMRNLETASRLVASFKQLAVTRSSEPRRAFELAELGEALRQSRGRQVQEAGHRLELALPDGLVLDSYPGPLRQVLEQLVDNALEHGLAGRTGGCIRLSASAPGGAQVRIVVEDDGQGIAPEHLGRVFDPFYTTRFGQGTNGLGLHLGYILVTSLLGGQISVHSAPGQGARFDILLPRVAPQG